ncbi:MAG TPA: serine/threonine-protein kinase [Kofleriaceae bacterium]|jgi:serine/threonine-protein kinase
MSLVGEVLGSYRITEELSSGGVGTVYRAHHELLGRPAAVKVLRASAAPHDAIGRFFTEARAASAIRHPGIVEVLDFGYAADGVAFLVMELLEGESLTATIARGKLSEDTSSLIARGIASALAAAHAKGIYHRDLKPDNVVVVAGNRPKLVDFGVAKLADRDSGHTPTVDGTLLGTPSYMAPEQARAASAVDHRADLYSLGCILYEMVVGKPPFAGGNTGELIAMHLFQEPVPPRARGVAISPRLEAVIVRLLQKDPEARYASADDVVAALASEPPSPPRRARIAVVAGLVTLGLVAGAIALVVGERSEPAAPVAPVATPQAAPIAAAPPPVVPIPAPPAPPAPPPPAPVVKAKPHKRPVVQRPNADKKCDGLSGEHDPNCSPIESTP